MLFRLILTPSDGLELARIEGRSTELLGVTGADALADPLAALARIHPADREIVVGALRDSALELPARPIRFRARAPAGAGEYAPRLLTWTCFRDGDRTEWNGAIVASSEEPLQRSEQRMQKQLLQTDRLASLGTMAAGMAHEINNPLAYLMANLTFLKEELERLKPTLPAAEGSELLEAVAESRDGVVRVRDIVRQLRRFSRVDDEPVRPIDLGEVLDGAVRMACHELGKHGRFEAEYRGRAELFANEAQLVQVFLNLLANAAQSLSQCERTERTVRLAMRADSDQAEVMVSDTGAGMPPEAVAKIFDPFFTTKPIGSGTGLGLAVSHSIVTGLGGKIAVDSVPGEGTTFTVSLPASGTPARERPAAVLVLEDELSTLELLQRALRGHSITYTWSPEHAITEARERVYDAFVWALSAPEDARRMCEALTPWRAPPAERPLALAPAGYRSDAWDGLPLRILEKPLAPDALAEVLEPLRAGRTRGGR